MSGLQFENLVAVEGFGWIIDNFHEKSSDVSYMEKLRSRSSSMLESNDDLIAMSQHTNRCGTKKINRILPQKDHNV